MRFTPTLLSQDTSRNVRDFVKDHHDYLMQLIKYIAPYLLIVTAVSTVVGYLGAQVFAQEMAEKFQNITDSDPASFFLSLIFGALFNFWGMLGLLFSFALAYLYACIGISWHRLVLLGAENYKPVNVLRPEKNDIQFFLLLITFNVVPIVVVAPALVNANVFTMFLLVFGTCAMFYYLYRVSFLFPAKAVNAKLSLKTSCALTKGYFWAFNMALLRAMIRIVAIIIIYAIIVETLVGFVFPVNTEEMDFTALFQPKFSTHILPSITYLPISIYFQPLLTVFGVTVLSNYYQYALQHKPESSDVEV